MISGQNIVKYLLFFVFSQFLMAAPSFANPIPVFCLAGWGNYECCKGITSIREANPEGQDKWYYLNSTSIREANPEGQDKWYYCN